MYAINKVESSSNSQLFSKCLSQMCGWKSVSAAQDYGYKITYLIKWLQSYQMENICKPWLDT